MDLRPNFDDVTRATGAPNSTAQRPTSPLSELVWGDVTAREDLPLPEFVGALLSLASGSRTKVLIPLETTPTEIALVRENDRVALSCYETGSLPEVFVLHRTVSIQQLLRACADEARASATMERSPARSTLLEKLAEQIDGTAIVRAPSGHVAAVCRRGGALFAPGSAVPLAFGFSTRIRPSTAHAMSGAAKADVHALLFEGALWAYVRGRRVLLAEGPILLPVLRMIAAVRASLEAWELGRPLNIRLRSGDFAIGIRVTQSGQSALTLHGDGTGPITATDLNLSELALPILKVASDLLKTLFTVDRSQMRNLRAQSLRAELRTLRRTIRQQVGERGFTNPDPGRLRASSPPETIIESVPHANAPAGTLRFQERWRAELDELDASTTFFCGDRLVTAVPHRVAALCRDTGNILWARNDTALVSAMAGKTLLRMSVEGKIDLCDVEDGEAFATASITPRENGPPLAMHIDGPAIPPSVVVAEGARRLSAIDLRTGEARWSFASRGPGLFKLCRSSRVLVAVGGDGTVDALDILSGDPVWRFADRARFSTKPSVSEETVLLASGEIGGFHGALYGIDLYTGEPRWRRTLDAVPCGPPIVAKNIGIVAMGGGRRGSLCAFDTTDGSLRWAVPDPGVGSGAATMALDSALLINTPGGRMIAMSLQDGSTRWSADLGHSTAEDVPRRLEPVLRGGALFIPANAVHVLRPADGARLGEPLARDVVPDLVRVDERGWIYVAEESGIVTAFAPGPQLSLVPQNRPES